MSAINQAASQSPRRECTFELVGNIVAAVSDYLLSRCRPVNISAVAEEIERLKAEASRCLRLLSESYDRERELPFSQVGLYTGTASVAYTRVLKRIDAQVKLLRQQQLIDWFLCDFRYHLYRESRSRLVFDPPVLVIAVMRMVEDREAEIAQLWGDHAREWDFDPTIGPSSRENRRSDLQRRLNAVLGIES